MKKKRHIDVDGPDKLTHNPFAALRPDGAAPTTPLPPPEQEPRADGRAAAGRVVVRREKKGRAGKTVTRIAGLALGEPGLAAVARDMKRALGCGATVEDDDVVLQGALTERAADWLRENGHDDVVVGN